MSPYLLAPSFDGRPRARRRFNRTACSAFALLLALSACAGGPSAMNPADDNSKEATLLKVADETTAGGDPATAVTLYKQLHDLSPKDPVPVGRMGGCFMMMKDYREAADAYRVAVALAPDNSDYHRGLAMALLFIGDGQSAMIELRAAMTKKADDVRLYSLMGVAEDMTGHHDLAQMSYKHGLELDPGSVGLRNNYALSLALAGNYQDAIARLAEIAGPDAAPRYRLNLALAYGLAGDDTKAAATAREVLDDGAVRNNLDYYSLLRGMDETHRSAAIIDAELHGTPIATAEASGGTKQAAFEHPNAPPTPTPVAAADLPLLGPAKTGDLPELAQEGAKPARPAHVANATPQKEIKVASVSGPARDATNAPSQPLSVDADVAPAAEDQAPSHGAAPKPDAAPTPVAATQPSASPKPVLAAPKLADAAPMQAAAKPQALPNSAAMPAPIVPMQPSAATKPILDAPKSAVATQPVTPKPSSDVADAKPAPTSLQPQPNAADAKPAPKAADATTPAPKAPALAADASLSATKSADAQPAPTIHADAPKPVAPAPVADATKLAPKTDAAPPADAGKPAMMLADAQPAAAVQPAPKPAAPIADATKPVKPVMTLADAAPTPKSEAPKQIAPTPVADAVMPAPTPKLDAPKLAAPAPVADRTKPAEKIADAAPAPTTAPAVEAAKPSNAAPVAEAAPAPKNDVVAATAEAAKPAPATQSASATAQQISEFLAQHMPPATKAPAAEPAKSTAAATTAEAAPQATTPASTSVERFVVQLGSWMSEGTAKHIADGFAAKGVPVSIMRSTDPSGNAWYVVRSTDFATAEEAQPVLAQVKAIGGVNPMIVRHRVTAAPAA